MQKKIYILFMTISVAIIFLGVHSLYAITNIDKEYTDTQYLASKWYIEKQYNKKNYRISDNITRKEMMKIIINTSNIKLDNSCNWIFEDVINDWWCKYIESALENWLITWNSKFRPNNNITKIETLKLILNTKWIQKVQNTDDWKKDYIITAYNNKIIDKMYTDYDTVVTRWWIFSVLYNSIVSKWSSDNKTESDNKTNNNKCWDGTCDNIEKSKWICPTDCNNKTVSDNISFQKSCLSKDQTKAYVTIGVNISDYYDPELLEKNLNRLFDIYDKYHIKPDLYFSEPALKSLEKYSDLIERIKSSEAWIAYQYRRPHPAYDSIISNAYYKDKCVKVADLSYQEKIKLLKEYEKYAMNLTEENFWDSNYCTKLSSQKGEKGWIEYLQEIFGDVLVAAISNTLDPDLERAEAEILVWKGVKMFVVEHFGNTKENTLLEKKYNAYQRPSDFGFLNLNDSVSQLDKFYDELNKFNYNRPVFIPIVNHEYDFYKNAGWELTPKKWKSIYLSNEQQDKMFDEYEKMLSALVSDSQIKIINSQNILDIFEFNENCELMPENNSINTNTQKCKDWICNSLEQEKNECDTDCKEDISDQWNNPVYVTFYTHNEAGWIWKDYLDNETKYKEYRNDLIKKIKLLNSYWIKLNWETDTTILLAMKKWEKWSLLADTNNKNILRWMVEDMNMIIDPHWAKDNAYNYADIAYMIEEFWVKSSGVVGWFILYSCDNNWNIQTKDNWYDEIWISEDWLIYGQKYPDFSWKPTIIWQPAMVWHNYDEFSSWVWKPSENNFAKHSTSGKYIYVWQWYPHTKKLIPKSSSEIFVNDTEYIDELIEKIDSWKLSNKEMFTVSIHLRDEPNITTYDNLKDFLESLEKLKNKIIYLDYESVWELWQKEYNSTPSKVEISNFSFYNDILSDTCKSNNSIQDVNNTNTQKCWDWICDSTEQSKGVCDTDCK